jgi:hypothetical protein
MKRTNKQLDEILDRVGHEIGDDSVDSKVVKGVSDRVMARLSTERELPVPEVAQVYVEHIRGCEDFQRLIPSYLRGSLSSARTMLLEDHTQECIPCRKALKLARVGRPVATPSLGQSAVKRHMAAKWAVAAALIAAVSIGSAVLIRRSGRSAQGVYAMVESVYGSVYRVSDTESEGLTSSGHLGTGEKIRTAKDAGAVVRLPDGSIIEMKERSEFSVTESSQGVTIHLERGNIIVQAAKQRSRNLFVSTNDCMVSVKGTIFSVNNGTKGSRVSVIEGEVHVDHSGEQDILKPGDQVSTNRSIEAIPVKDEIAWSRDRERYAKMLAEIESIRREIDTKAPRPEVRYSTRLLDMVPAGTVLYVALPNLSATLSESHRIMEERIQQNPALGQWWQKEQGSRKGFDRIIDKIREVGEYVGDEIAVSATMDAEGEPEDLVVLAELKNGPGFRSYLEQQIDSVTTGTKKPAVRFVEDPMTVTKTSSPYSKTRDDVYIWINGDVFAASPRLESLRQVADAAANSNAKRFSESSFYARIAELYRDGAGLIVAADLEAIIGEGARTGKEGKGGKGKDEAFRQLGITNLKHFIFELKETGGKAQNRAVVTFDKTERGLASWLAAPGPMGALQFISPDANVVAAFVVKQPVGLVDDLLGALRSLDPSLWQHLKDGEAEHGIDIRNDFAAPLGGEFAFAVDGPVLPVPSWKLVFEVNDPGHLQQTFERIVDKLNEYAAREGKRGFEWERTEAGERTFYTLKSVDFGLSVTYTYANGYLVAGPSRALVDRAVRYRESGYTLLHSPRFIAALPEDKNANFSALFYQNLAPMLGSVARQLGGSARVLPEEGRNTLRSLAGAAPVLAYAYAQDDRIIFSANGEDGPLGLKPSSLMGLPGSFGISQILGSAMH